MTDALKIAGLYFELSNKSDFGGIEALFTDSTTYSSQAMGVYLGVDSIMAMQRAFHEKFSALHWRVNSVKEIKPGVVLFDFSFRGTMLNGKKNQSSGLEYVIVYQGKIVHIEGRRE